jgi:membrane associated rhomboid family serine protease
MMNEPKFRFTPSVLAWPLFMVLVLWIVFWFEVRFKVRLSEYGILPRTWQGLQGIIFSPFLHGDIKHLYNNSIPLLLLIAALRFFYRDIALKVLGFGILLTGIITWIIARESYHIGASGLVYVLVSFMFFKGIQTKFYRLVALSLAIVMVYGGLVWYVFPNVGEDRISWEGHLAGLISGILLSLIHKTPEYQKTIKYDWEKPDFDPQQDPFMKHFDAQGNFVPTPKPEEEIQKYFTTSINVIYDFIGKENPAKGDKSS